MSEPQTAAGRALLDRMAPWHVPADLIAPDIRAIEDEAARLGIEHDALPAHAQYPTTTAGRRLLGKNMTADTAKVEWLANDVWAIEAEARQQGEDEAARKEQERIAAAVEAFCISKGLNPKPFLAAITDTGEALREANLRQHADGVHTVPGAWPECPLCRKVLGITDTGEPT